MDFFSENTEIEGVDNINACYGGTAALLNTIRWCRVTGKKGIVVVTDAATFDEKIGWWGASAVAMLVGPNPAVEITEKIFKKIAI